MSNKRITFQNSVVVTDIGLIRALNGVPGDMAVVASAEVHGPFWFDASDTTTGDDNRTCIVAVDGGRWKLVVLDADAVEYQPGSASAYRDGSVGAALAHLETESGGQQAQIDVLDAAVFSSGGLEDTVHAIQSEIDSSGGLRDSINYLLNFVLTLATGIGATFIGTLAKGSSFVRTLQDALRDSASPSGYGGDNTGTVLADTAIAAALANNTSVDLGDGTNTWKISSPILVPTGKQLIARGANIVVDADAVGVRVLGQSSRAAGFSVTWSVATTSNGVEVGDVANNARQAILERITVTGAGGHSFVGRHGNLCKIINCSSIAPAGDDFHCTTETVDCNDWTWLGNDGNAAGRDGIHLDGITSTSDAHNPRSHIWIGGSIQSATRYSLYSNTPKNTFKGIYLEAGGTTVKDVYLDTFSVSTVVEPVECGQYTNVPGAPGGNRILHPNPDASLRRIDVLKALFGGGAGNGIGIVNNDGTAGQLDIEKTGSVTYGLIASGSAQDAFLQVKNSNSSFALHEIIDGTLAVKHAPISNGAGSATFGATHQLTVGSAGAAAAQPATPALYLQINVDGTLYVMALHKAA